MPEGARWRNFHRLMSLSIRFLKLVLPSGLSVTVKVALLSLLIFLQFLVLVVVVKLCILSGSSDEGLSRKSSREGNITCSPLMSCISLVLSV